jgi:hypothetical protein
MIKARPAIEPITPPAIVPGGVDCFDVLDPAAASEVVGFGHFVDVVVALETVLVLELEDA